MTDISFYARGDSSSANNAALNTQGTSTTPVTQITFTSGSGGDVALDFNSGSYDPDTWVVIDGVTYQFTVEFSGTLPDTNKMQDVAGVDLSGEEVVVITASNGQRYFFLPDGTGTLAVMEDFPNGATALGNVSQTGPILVCFVRGTRIATDRGERPVQDLRAGDRIETLDGRMVPLRWVGRRRVGPAEQRRYPHLCPVVIRAHSFGHGRPARDLRLSRQHRILVQGWAVELLFGQPEVLAPAHRFGSAMPPADRDVWYYHLLFDTHEIVLSEGLPTESYQPAMRGLAGFDGAVEQELRLLFPELPGLLARPDACAALSGRESAALAGVLAR